MNTSELMFINIGEKLTFNPLLKLGGLDLGGVEFILAARTGNTMAFDVRWLGVKIGSAAASIMSDKIIDWSFHK